MTPPVFSLPTWTTTRPSATSGELDVWNVGNAPVSIRQSFSPLSAFRHESVPLTPKVTTLPSATVGEARGPGYMVSPLPLNSASYLSFHTSLPVAASRQRVTSAPPSRLKTNSLSPTSAGVATPSPTVSFHAFLSSLGQGLGGLEVGGVGVAVGPAPLGPVAAAGIGCGGAEQRRDRGNRRSEAEPAGTPREVERHDRTPGT